MGSLAPTLADEQCEIVAKHVLTKGINCGRIELTMEDDTAFKADSTIVSISLES